MNVGIVILVYADDSRPCRWNLFAAALAHTLLGVQEVGMGHLLGVRRQIFREVLVVEGALGGVGEHEEVLLRARRNSIHALKNSL